MSPKHQLPLEKASLLGRTFVRKLRVRGKGPCTINPSPEGRKLDGTARGKRPKRTTCLFADLKSSCSRDKNSLPQGEAGFCYEAARCSFQPKLQERRGNLTQAAPQLHEKGINYKLFFHPDS